jgi:cobalt-zinc-cadmium efflux system protein
MSHDHSHQHLTAGARHRRPLAIAFGLTAGFLIVEAVVGFAIGSLALISDAGHMLTDTVGLGMALTAITLAQRPATDRRTFGSHRLEALAALANAVLLFGVAVYVLYEAIRRLQDPADVPGLGLFVVAALGLLVNLVGFLLLRRGAEESINVRGAFLEVTADMIGSVGVLIAGVVMMLSGWMYADAIVGVAIGLWVLPRAYRLGRDALHVLMEGAPSHVDVAALRTALSELPGVSDAHDLHVWTLTSGTDVASAHLRLEPNGDADAAVRAATAIMRDRFSIAHTTVQAEAFDHPDCEPVV